MKNIRKITMISILTVTSLFSAFILYNSIAKNNDLINNKIIEQQQNNTDMHQANELDQNTNGDTAYSEDKSNPSNNNPTNNNPNNVNKSINNANSTSNTSNSPAKSANSASQVPSTQITNSSSAQFRALQIEIINLVNQQRTNAGLKPLSEYSALTSVAMLKAEDLAINNYFDHISPTYGSPGNMIKNKGINYSSAGENIAKGQTSAQQVMNDWMNSPGHRANILNNKYTQIGVGIARNVQGQYVWVQMFIGT